MAIDDPNDHPDHRDPSRDYPDQTPRPGLVPPSPRCAREDCPTPDACPGRGCDLYTPESDLEQRLRCDRPPGPRRYLAAIGGRVAGRVLVKNLALLTGPPARA